MMTEGETFRQQVLAAIKAGDGLPVMAYADYLQDHDESFPEFFRLLGTKVAEYPDWLVQTWTAKELCDGFWDCGTGANRYIHRSIVSADLSLQRERPFDRGSMWIGVPPLLAGQMARSLEVRDVIPVSYWGKLNAQQQRVWRTYGLPVYLYGFRVHVFDANVVPDDYAVLIDERVKVFGLITECVQ